MSPSRGKCQASTPWKEHQLPGRWGAHGLSYKCMWMWRLQWSRTGSGGAEVARAALASRTTHLPAGPMPVGKAALGPVENMAGGCGAKFKAQEPRWDDAFLFPSSALRVVTCSCSLVQTDRPCPIGKILPNGSCMLPPLLVKE